MGQLSSVAIRRASDDDLPEMARVESSAKSVISEFWLASASSRYTGAAVFTYLSEDVRPFGFVTSGSPVEEYFRDNQTGEILGLYVHPEYQGFGYGKKLLVHGLSVLKRRGFESAIIWIPEISQSAIAVSSLLNFEKLDGVYMTDNQAGGVGFECYKLDLTAYF